MLMQVILSAYIPFLLFRHELLLDTVYSSPADETCLPRFEVLSAHLSRNRAALRESLLNLRAAQGKPLGCFSIHSSDEVSADVPPWRQPCQGSPQTHEEYCFIALDTVSLFPVPPAAIPKSANVFLLPLSLFFSQFHYFASANSPALSSLHGIHFWGLRQWFFVDSK